MPCRWSERVRVRYEEERYLWRESPAITELKPINVLFYRSSSWPTLLWEFARFLSRFGCHIALKLSPLKAWSDVPGSPRLSWFGLLSRGYFSVRLAMILEAFRCGS